MCVRGCFWLSESERISPFTDLEMLPLPCAKIHTITGLCFQLPILCDVSGVVTCREGSGEGQEFKLESFPPV